MIKRIVVLSLMGFGFTAAFGQTAKVIALDKADAEYVKSLYDQKAAIEHKLSLLHEAVIEKYLIDETIKIDIEDFPDKTNVSFHPQSNNTKTGKFGFRSDSGKWVSFISGWEDGTFEFSDDFKFIVPPHNVFQLGDTISCCNSGRITWQSGTTEGPPDNFYYSDHLTQGIATPSYDLGFPKNSIKN